MELKSGDLFAESKKKQTCLATKNGEDKTRKRNKC